MEKKILLILLISLIFLFGCTEITRQEKNLCTKLTDQSYTYIPACETIPSCFEKVNLIFKTSLSYEQESRLYSLKNGVAKSWYYFNKAKKEAKTISKLCGTAGNSSFSGNINQLRFYIDESFSELDQAVKISFDIIFEEEKILTHEEVDLIKEEALYDSLVETRQILVELKGEKTNSGTYISYYKEKAQAFEKSTFSKGIPQIIEKTPFWIGEMDSLGSIILNPDNLPKNALMPFLGVAFSNAVSFIETSFYEKQNLLALQTFPVNEFMKLYSEIGGNDKSAIKIFSDTINKLSQNKTNAKKTAKKLWDEIESSGKECETLLSKLKERKQKELIYNELVQTTVTTKKDAEEDYVKTMQKIILLREEKNGNKLTLGKELNKLKEIKNSIESIKKQAALLLEDYDLKLAEACEKKAKEISKLVCTSDQKQLIKLLEEAKYFGVRVLSTKDYEKIQNCEELVIKSKLFFEYESNQAQMESLLKSESKDCFEYLEKTFQYDSPKELKLMFEELKRSEITKDNLYELKEACENIKKQVQNELGDDYFISKILKEYDIIKQLVFETEKIKLYLPESNWKTFEQIKINIKDYEKFFDDKENILFYKIIPVKEDFFENITAEKAKLENIQQEKIIEYAQKTQETLILNELAAETNKDLNSLSRIVLKNPFKDLKKEIMLKIKKISAEVIKKSENVVEILGGETAILSNFPKGETTIDFISTHLIKTEEKDSFIYVSNEKSLLQRKIFLSNEGEISLLNVSTALPKGAKNIVVIVDEKEELFSNDEKNIKFNVKQAGKKTQITLLIYIDDLIKTNFSVLRTEKNDFGEKILFELTATNSHPLPLSAELLFTIPSENYSKIQVYDEYYAEKKIYELGSRILLKNQGFLGLQSKKYILLIETDTIKNYYKTALEKLADYFYSKGNENKAKEIDFFLSEENSVEKLMKAYEKYSKEKEKLSSDEEEKQRIELLKSSLELKLKELFEAKEEMILLGMDKEAQKLGQFLIDSDSIKKETEADFAKLFDKISSLSFDINNLIKLKSENFVLEAQKIANLSPETQRIAEKIYETKKKLDQVLPFDPLTARTLFLEIGVDYNKLILEKTKALENELFENESKKKAFMIHYKTCGEIIDYLSDSLTLYSAELIKARFLQPITVSRLQKLSFSLDELKNSDLTWEEKEEQIKKIEDELLKAFNYSRKQAVHAFNEAIDLKKGENILSQSKELIDSNRPIDALIVLKNGEEDDLFNIPYAGFIPILLIALIAFVAKYSIKKKTQIDEEKKEAIQKGWED